MLEEDAGSADECWEPAVSREEWLLMYVRGLNFTQIAHLCRVKRLIVYRYIRAAERRDPTISGRRLVLHNQPSPAPPGANHRSSDWDSRFAQLRTFLGHRNRMPQQLSADQEERHLCRWLYAQRYQYQRGGMSPARQELLDSLGHWQRTRRPGTPDERWDAQLERLTTFIDAEKRFPVQRKRRLSAESQLAIWLQTQRSRGRKGTLRAARWQSLNQAIPNWIINRTTDRQG